MLGLKAANAIKDGVQRCQPGTHFSLNIDCPDVKEVVLAKEHWPTREKTIVCGVLLLLPPLWRLKRLHGEEGKIREGARKWFPDFSAPKPSTITMLRARPNMREHVQDWISTEPVPFYWVHGKRKSSESTLLLLHS